METGRLGQARHQYCREGVLCLVQAFILGFVSMRSEYSAGEADQPERPDPPACPGEGRHGGFYGVAAIDRPAYARGMPPTGPIANHDLASATAEDPARIDR
ncbi:hypothetical protein GCM10009078_49410 [Cupriavidus gilardii]